MFNPRLEESNGVIISNEWVNFARLHTHHFWKEGIAYSRIPGCHCRDLQKTLFRQNGFGEGWPATVYSANDIIFCGTLKEAYCADKTFTIIQHPIARLLQIPRSLHLNLDSCASTWLEKTGSSWHSLSLHGLLDSLASDNDLLSSSHWWCLQEFCLLFRPSHYTRIFRQKNRDDLAWWLGENNIQLIRDEPTLEWEPNLNRLPTKSDLSHQPLSQIIGILLESEANWDSFVDESLIEKAQDLYRKDFEIYANS